MTVMALVAGCTAPAPVPAPPPPAEPSPAASSPPSQTSPSSVVRVTYRIEVRADVTDFEEGVVSTLSDPRGWQRAGFDLVRTADAPYVVVVAEPATVDQLCLPYETYGRYSCQNGPVVAINADRWRTATPQWTGDLATYRQMLINHEFGHLLGQRHPPAPQCPVPGEPALVMSQQSTELNGCRPNPWPLPAEIARAAQHDLPLAPP